MVKLHIKLILGHLLLQAKLKLDNKTNIVDLNSKLKKIDLIENIYVQDFNKDYMSLRIKYLGKLEKIINQLKKEYQFKIR